MEDGDEDTGGKPSLGLSGRMTLLTHTGRKEMTDHGPAYLVQPSLMHSLCLRNGGPWEAFREQEKLAELCSTSNGTVLDLIEKVIVTEVGSSIM